jgi:hypothetical protein
MRFIHEVINQEVNSCNFIDLDSSCESCYDFCFPDYAIQRREKYEDQISFAIRRLNCFRHYVPEWINYQIEADAEGGHWSYPKRPQDTQRDEHGDWIRNTWSAWSPVSVVGRPDSFAERTDPFIGRPDPFINRQDALNGGIQDSIIGKHHELGQRYRTIDN